MTDWLVMYGVNAVPHNILNPKQRKVTLALPSSLVISSLVISSLVISSLVISILSFTGCSKPAPAAKQEAPRPVRAMVVGEATQAALSMSSLSLPGEIRPRIESRLGFRVGGKLMQRLLNVGEAVKAGQVIARLDPQDAAPGLASAQAQLEGARTEVKIAQIELKRVADLVEKNFVSKAQLDRQQATADAASSRLNAAEAALKQARNAIDFQTLVADVDGIITGVEAEVGQVLAAGTPVYRVARRSEKELLINVPETELAAARTVSQWQVILPALNRELQGKLREVTPLADPASRTYAMRLTLNGNLDGVEMGMTANAMARRGGSTASNLIALPLGAIFSKDGKPKVWIVDAAGAVSLVAVEIESINEEQVFVRSGLSSGQKVVTAGANLLKLGQVVRVEGASK
jgi:membrane fusion protein, multidrug efflux system